MSRGANAYLSRPSDGPGPGVLMLCSWWGLTEAMKDRCDDLSGRGFSALAPDLMAGEQPETPDEARAALAEVDVNRVADLCLSSAAALRAATNDPDGPIAVVGYGSGGSFGLWMAARQPDSVRRVVSYYGVTDLDFVDLKAEAMVHIGEDDAVVGDDELTEFHAGLLLLEKSILVERYPGVGHGFAEHEAPGFDAAAADLAWQRTIDFLTVT